MMTPSAIFSCIFSGRVHRRKECDECDGCSSRFIWCGSLYRQRYSLRVLNMYIEEMSGSPSSFFCSLKLKEKSACQPYASPHWWNRKRPALSIVVAVPFFRDLAHDQ